MRLPCAPPGCRICRAPGPRVCLATHLADLEEIHDEDKADLMDALRAEAFAARPSGRYQTNSARGWDENGLWGFVEEDPARG